MVYKHDKLQKFEDNRVLKMLMFSTYEKLIIYCFSLLYLCTLLYFVVQNFTSPVFTCSDFFNLKWGGGECNVFLAFYAISNISIKNGRWFRQIVDRDSGNLYIQYI